MRFFIVCLLLLAPMIAECSQYDNQVVTKIDINLVNVPEEASGEQAKVLAKIKTKEGGLFSQYEFDSDLKTLAQDFDCVDPWIEMCDNGLVLHLKIFPKPIIRTIKYSGNERIASKTLQGELEIPLLSVYDRKNFNLAFHKLKAYYVKKGFFEAELDYCVTPDPKSNEVDIEIIICEGRSGHIKNINFVNFSPKEQAELLEKIYTKEYNFLTSWMSGEGTYNEEAVRQDEFTVLSYLQDQGYADAKVKINVKETKKDKSIELDIVADKGQPYKFGQISIEGSCIVPVEELKKHIQIEEGSPFSSEKARESARALMEAYGKKGYIDTLVDFDLNLDYEKLTYTIKYRIEEGESYRVGLVKVFGNSSTLTSVILHETLLIPGEVFNIQKLKLTEQRLQNIGYFKNVNVYAVKSDGPCGLGDNYRDVHIEVEEMCTGSFNLFGALSSVEDIAGGITITERNFNLAGLRNVSKYGMRTLRGGGEFADFKASLGTKSRNYSLNWVKPYFMDTPWSIGFSLENTNNRYISETYDLDTYSLRVHGAYQVNPFFRRGWHWRLQFSNMILHGKCKDEKCDPDAKQPEDLRQAAGIQNVTSAVGLNFVYDSTDHPAKPSCGLRSRLEMELAGFGGDVNFFSVAYLNSWYLKINPRGVMRFRADARFLQPMGETNTLLGIPVDERFFLGGETGVRGYRDYAPGPHFRNKDCPNKNSPKGGISSQIYTIEYNHFLNPYMDVFLFYDAGTLSDRTWTFGHLYQSVGIGSRVLVPALGAPVTFGYGVPFTARNATDRKNFFIQMGGRF